MKVLLQPAIPPTQAAVTGPRFGADRSEDSREADWVLRRQAREGDNDARLALTLREKGYEYVSRDMMIGIRLVAESGMALMQHDYAIMLYNAAKPKWWEELAAVLLFRKLKEVPDDLVEAVKWFTLASREKNRTRNRFNPEIQLKHLKNILPQEKFEEGEARAAQWLREQGKKNA